VRNEASSAIRSRVSLILIIKAISSQINPSTKARELPASMRHNSLMEANLKNKLKIH